ncbi:MAG: BrnA antitoxin family protein [Cyanobacteria bacterium P01_F01_bin.150]
MRLPDRSQKQVSVTILVDADVMAWFQSLGDEGHKRMNAAL